MILKSHIKKEKLVLAEEWVQRERMVQRVVRLDKKNIYQNLKKTQTMKMKMKKTKQKRKKMKRKMKKKMIRNQIQRKNKNKNPKSILKIESKILKITQTIRNKIDLR